MTEKELIVLLKKKDREAFKVIVEQYEDTVYNTSLGMLQNEEDAEDIAQEVFMQVFESIHSFKEESKFSTWLYRITITKSLDYLRKKKRKKRFSWIQGLYGENDEEMAEAPDFMHPGIKLENKEEAAVLFKAIEKLPEKQKAAFILNKLESLSYAEIAEIMGTSIVAVDSLFQRSKKNLRKDLAAYYKMNAQ
ncbi:MAG: RNA polymerase sigma factor [Ginsengibacter sp.]